MFNELYNVLRNLATMLGITYRYNSTMSQLGRYYPDAKMVMTNTNITSWEEFISTLSHELGHAAHDVLIGLDRNDLVNELVADKFCYELFEAYGLEVPASREAHFMAKLAVCEDADDEESDKIVEILKQKLRVFFVTRR